MRQASRRDAYDVIGVRQDAALPEVKRAFRERAKETHPDVNTSPEAKEDFIRLVAAYREAEAGDPNEVRNVTAPAALCRRSRQALVKRKWTFLTVGALGVFVYVRSGTPPPEDPVVLAAGLHKSSASAALPRRAERSENHNPQDVEPVWVTSNRGAFIPPFGRQITKSITLARKTPASQAVLRHFIVEMPQRDLDRYGSSNGPRDAALPDTRSSGAAVQGVAPPAFVSVMPRPRPKMIGETKHRRLAPTVPKKRYASIVPVRSSAASPAVSGKSDISILDQLPALLGLK